MSTRSIIARKTEEGFEGTYHHWDGYPSGLGYSLWHIYKSIAIDQEGSLEDMLDLLIDAHPTGWSSINGVDWTQPIGYVSDYAEGKARNAPMCFCHGDRQETVDEPFTNLTNCGAEFAYAFEKDKEKETDLMHIYEKQYDDGSHAMEFFRMTNPDGAWQLVETVDILERKEPYWKGIGSWGAE